MPRVMMLPSWCITNFDKFNNLVFLFKERNLLNFVFVWDGVPLCDSHSLDSFFCDIYARWFSLCHVFFTFKLETHCTLFAFFGAFYEYHRGELCWFVWQASYLHTEQTCDLFFWDCSTCFPASAFCESHRGEFCWLVLLASYIHTEPILQAPFWACSTSFPAQNSQYCTWFTSM